MDAPILAPSPDTTQACTCPEMPAQWQAERGVWHELTCPHFSRASVRLDLVREYGPEEGTRRFYAHYA